MSYCVNCGVELDPGAQACPLCGTPALASRPVRAALLPHQPCGRTARIQARGRYPADSHAGIRVPVLRAAEPLSAHRAAMVSVCDRSSGDAVGLVRPAHGAAADPRFSPPHGRRGGHRHLRLAHFHRSERRRVVPRAGSAHDRMGWCSGISAELSAPGRTPLHPLLHCAGDGAAVCWPWH